MSGESVSIAANRCGGNVSHASVKDGSGKEVVKFEFPDADTQAKVDELCALIYYKWDLKRDTTQLLK